MKLAGEKGKAAVVVEVGMAERHGVHVGDLRSPQVPRHDALADVEGG